MNKLRTTSKPLNNIPPNLSLYDKYGAVAYGVILQIIPQEQLAQEILVELFQFPFQNCSAEISDVICIIRNARAKALEFSNRFKSLLPPNEDSNTSEKEVLPDLIFNLAFKQGIPLESIAERLGISKEATMKAISEHVKSFRKS